jgi:hypothetical protein
MTVPKMLVKSSFHNDPRVYAVEPMHDGVYGVDPKQYLVGAIGKLLRRKTIVDRDLDYRFFAHFHPWVGELVHELIEGSVAGLQAADTDYLRDPDGTAQHLPDGKPRPRLYEELFTSTRYTPSAAVATPHPAKDVDFSVRGAYAVYNWELFYHVPLTVAIHLSRNERFEEAQRWFHFVFDPTSGGPDPAPDRYWGVRPFHHADVRSIEEVLANLSTGADPELLADTIASIGAWKDAPFRPHLVARYRQSAYMLKAVTSYIDNLVAWGDALFRQDTGESVNEATQLYVLAANVLGPRPQEAPRKGWQQPQTYESLRPHLDAMSNALAEVEVDIPFDVLPAPTPGSDPAPLATLRSAVGALYFCVPRNDKLVAYWDTVADRLFKIRNSLNIQGVFRQLPLFEPPIDPAMLVKAAAAGLDVGAVIAGLNQPLPLVRFGFLVAKAAEIAQEVKSLGAHLLSAIEKEDAEALAILRARHDSVLLDLGEVVRYEQWQEAGKAREALERSFAGAAARYTYYERLLGRQENEIKVEPLDELDVESLEKMRFRSGEPAIAPRPIGVDIASDLSGSQGRKVSSFEATELTLLWDAQLTQDIAAGLDALAAGLAIIPDIEASAKPMGVGAGVRFGGSNLSHAVAAGAHIARGVAGRLTFEGNRAAKIGGYARREQEWSYQSNLAAAEITQIYKQWRAAQIREAIAEREWRNHQQQLKNAKEIEQFLSDDKTGKTSSRDLYAWLRREVRALHSQCFQLAYDVAKKAERALQHELGDPGQSFLQFGYTAGRQGLLAGEKLYLDVKRMELAYSELNRREYELTKHVSLRQVDPVALLRLRTTGRCEFDVPEELFDLDCPGHYFRRIKSASLSIPSVVGPSAGVNATLTLQRSSVRTSPALRDGEYARAGDDTERFSDDFGGVQSIVTSGGNQDSGLFETNLRDERYLPFEGSGAVSRWSLELPAELPQFDHATISDVVLHLRYTAREGGVPLRNASTAHLRTAVEAATTVGSVRMLSLRHEFPTEWARFASTALGGATTEAPLTVTLRDEHYPFWAGRVDGRELKRVELFAVPAESTKATVSVSVAPGAPAAAKRPLAKDSALGDMRVGTLAAPLPPPVGDLALFLDDNSMSDVWLALTWGAPA